MPPRTNPGRHALRFGRLVKRLRNARGLSQEGLAERADLSRDTITRLELGNFSPSLETLAKLVVGLDSSLTSLFASMEGHDDAAAREVLAMARRMSGIELALAVRVLALLAAMLRIVHGDDGGDQPGSEPDGSDD
jgi:transcriptional regulator with XRE-family HTH domain